MLIEENFKVKKVFSFIFGAFMIFTTLFSGIVSAAEPTESAVRGVYKELEGFVTDMRRQVHPDPNVYLKNMDDIIKRYSLYDKKFSSVCERYSRELENSLAPENIDKPIKLNCDAFASYAFGKYRKKGVNCQFLRILFERKYTVPSGKTVPFGHNVVLIPQLEGRVTSYYICDFHNAMVNHDAKLLFMPFEEYIHFINSVGFGRITEMEIIPENDTSYFHPVICLDLRIWFIDHGHNRMAALSVVNLEKSNNLMINLKVGRDISTQYQRCVMTLFGLYSEVSPVLANEFAIMINRRLMELQKKYPNLR